MKITFTNGGVESVITINNDAQFKKFIGELRSILEGSDQFKSASYQQSSYLDVTVPSDFIRNSIVKVDYSNHA